MERRNSTGSCGPCTGRSFFFLANRGDLRKRWLVALVLAGPKLVLPILLPSSRSACQRGSSVGAAVSGKVG
jgi:hypothetical protein